MKARLMALMSASLMLVLAACAALPGTNTTLSQLPNLPGSYNQYEGQQLWEQGGSAAILASLFAGQPELAALAGTISTIGGCAQEKGIANWRAYVSKDDITAAGVVLVASQNQMSNPAALFECALADRMTLNESTFCSAQYSYTANNDTFYVLYAGSQERVCNDFCNSLTDCPNQQ